MAFVIKGLFSSGQTGPETPQAEARATAPAPAPAQAPVLPQSVENRAPTPEKRTSDVAGALTRLGVKKKHVIAAIERQKVTRDPLYVVARDLGLVSSEKIAEAIAIAHGYHYFRPEKADEIDMVDVSGLKGLMDEFRGYVPVGLSKSGGVVIAIPSLEIETSARNAFHDMKPEICIASERTIQRVYRMYFADTESSFDATVDQVKRTIRGGGDEDSADHVQRMICAMLRHACYMGASDIYVARTDRAGTLRIKVDGKGQIFKSLEVDVFERLINTLIMNSGKADMLRSEPQDTSVFIQSASVKADYEDIFSRYTFRMELVQDPVTHYKNAVIRINDSQSAEVDFSAMGFDRATESILRRYTNSPTGLVLVTGPTGSGKTTTLYALMREIDPIDRAIFTIERPVEYRHGSWIQHALPKTADEGTSARMMLKALLREAPDVILVGELRDDPELIKTTLAAANTGHLVFATLHTNSAAKAVMRLTEMGAPHDVLASVLKGVLAQRLVGVLCPHCKKPDERAETMHELNRPYLSSTQKTPYVHVGCERCGYTGFRGRKMIYESIDGDRIRSLIERRAPASEIEKNGISPGQSIWARGLLLVAQGVTSMDELAIRADRDIVHT